MPVHDWTRVISGIFHDFHQSWISEIRKSLNSGILPPEYYALAEQRSAGREPDVLALERRQEDMEPAEPMEPGRGGGVMTAPRAPLIRNAMQDAPRVEFIEEADREYYAGRATRLAIYHAGGDRIVAFVEIVSPGNKDRRSAVEDFLSKLDEALNAGCHLLVVDILPPGRHDPGGIHASFWEERTDTPHSVDDERPLGLSAYRSLWEKGAFCRTAYFQPVAVGKALPEMPLFLTPEEYVYVPLEATYLEAWRGVPKYWQEVIEGKREHTFPERSR